MQLLRETLPVRNSHSEECLPSIGAIVDLSASHDTLASLRPEALHSGAEWVRSLPMKQHMTVRQADCTGAKLVLGSQLPGLTAFGDSLSSVDLFRPIDSIGLAAVVDLERAAVIAFVGWEN